SQGEVGLEGAAPVGALVFDANRGHAVEQARLGRAGVDQHLGQRVNVDDLVLGVVDGGVEVQGAGAAGRDPQVARHVQALGPGIQAVGEVLHPVDAPEAGVGEDLQGGGVVEGGAKQNPVVDPDVEVVRGERE